MRRRHDGSRPVTLITGLVAVGLLISSWSDDQHPLLPGLTRAPLAFFLPFITWAVVRFGPPGASVALLTATVLTISAAARGLTMFHSLTPGETLLGLQLLLIAVAMPHLVLAAAIEERRQSSGALRERLRFEELLSQLSQAFVHVPSDKMDEAFDRWVCRVGERLHLDGLMLYRQSNSSGDLVLRSDWMRPGTGGNPRREPEPGVPLGERRGARQSRGRGRTPGRPARRRRGGPPRLREPWLRRRTWIATRRRRLGAWKPGVRLDGRALELGARRARAPASRRRISSAMPWPVSGTKTPFARARRSSRRFSAR